MKKILTILFALVILTGVVRSSEAQSGTPLELLFSGQNFSVDDKLFYDWVLFDMTSSDPLFDPDLNEIYVSPQFLDPMNPGFALKTFGHLQVSGNVLDLTFGFSVEVTDPNMLIKDVLFDLSLFERGGEGFMTAIEDVYSDSGDLLASLNLDTRSNIFLDSAEFEPQQKIHVEKNFHLEGLTPEDVIGDWSFKQHFSQVAIPEPATLFLIGIGLAGLIIARRKCKE